jgi:mono/diheme cytochrome c family protein
MRANKILLLATSLGTLLVLVWAAVAENCFAPWRENQRAVAAKSPPGSDFEIQLRQIVVPALKLTDRCPSCHVGMAAGESGIPGDRIYGKHAPVVHEPAEMGCTVCHGGQGRATVAADAHGNVPHWPEPMIPRRYALAGCGSCHTHLEVPNLAELRRGRALFERHDCLACHPVDGRGGTLRPGGTGGGEGPDLTRAGGKGFRPDWYDHHLRARAQAEGAPKPGALPWKAAFGEIPPPDRAAIETFLRSRVAAPGLVEAKALFHSLGCRGCHKVNDVGGTDGPDLSRAGQRDPGQTSFEGVHGKHTLANWFAEHFRAPARVVPGSQMPALPLTEAEIDQLVFYTFSLRRVEAPEAFWPRDRVRALRLRQREFAIDGATLYTSFCAACHGPRGEGTRYAGMTPFPAVASADFLSLATDDFLTATIQHGRSGRRMPAWGQGEGGLRPEEIRHVVRHLRALAGGVSALPDAKPRRWARGDPAAGGLLFAQNCASCHGAKGEGGEGGALNNPVLLSAATDTYLSETIRRGRRGTTMQGFDQASTVRRALAPDEIEAIVTLIRSWEKQR